MTLVLAGAGIDQNRVSGAAHHEGLVGDDDLAQGLVPRLRLHRGQMTAESRLVIGRKEILRTPPGSLAFDHRIDGDLADPDLPHAARPIVSKTTVAVAARL